jgi:colicin import membrane protein
MHASADRLEFAPPPQPAAFRAFVLAVIAHLLLMAALTWGINWKKDSDTVSAEAELWASVPQQAAAPLPQVVHAPPLPPVVQAPPPPVPKVEPPPVAPREPDIAVEQEKKRKLLAEQKREELERQKIIAERERKQELEREKKLEAKRKQEELRREQLAEQKAEQKAAEEKRRKEELAKAEKEKKEQAKKEEAKLAALRKENLARMMKGLEGGTGAPNATGAAVRSKGGPSASYSGRIAARIKRNIVFTDTVAGNPVAEAEIRVAPDGTIIGSRLIKSSGVKAWDDAVMRAIERTEVLPRDTDGSVVPVFPITFRVND